MSDERKRQLMLLAVAMVAILSLSLFVLQIVGDDGEDAAVGAAPEPPEEANMDRPSAPVAKPMTEPGSKPVRAPDDAPARTNPNGKPVGGDKE